MAMSSSRMRCQVHPTSCPLKPHLMALSARPCTIVSKARSVRMYGGLENAGEKIKEAAGITADTVKENVKDAQTGVKGGANSAGDAIKKQAGKALDAVSDAAKDLKQRVK